MKREGEMEREKGRRRDGEMEREKGRRRDGERERERKREGKVPDNLTGLQGSAAAAAGDDDQVSKQILVCFHFRCNLSTYVLLSTYRVDIFFGTEKMFFLLYKKCVGVHMLDMSTKIIDCE